jgi:hypothetical protein
VTGRERSTPRNPPRRRYAIPAFRNRIVVVFMVPLPRRSRRRTIFPEANIPFPAGRGLTPVKDGSRAKGETDPVEIPFPEVRR